jgi:hypothetical protein
MMTFSFLKNPQRITDCQDKKNKNDNDFQNVPDVQKLKDIQIGDTVKIIADYERFWVTVINIAGDLIKGRVDNFLNQSKPYNYGSYVIFEKRHIYQIRTDEEREAILSILPSYFQEQIRKGKLTYNDNKNIESLMKADQDFTIYR